jgi:hypothetical protein
MTENWVHRPHVVNGRVSISDILLYQGNGMVDQRTPILFASIVPNGDGSAIVGEFRRPMIQIVFAGLFRTFLFMFLLGFPTFVALGVYRDPSANFTPGLVVTILIPILILICIEVLIRRYSKITMEETQVVTSLIDRSLLDPQMEEEQVMRGNRRQRPSLNRSLIRRCLHI